MSEKFNKAIVQLLFNEPFFAKFSLQIKKVESRAIPTMGVACDKRSLSVKLLYNPDFVETLTFEQIRGVLIHEFYHVILQHVYSTRIGGKDPKLWNYATDLAINSMIPRNMLPEGVLVPGEGMFAKIEPGRPADAYYEILKKKAEENGQGQGQGQPGEGDAGSHEMWGKDVGDGQEGDSSAWGEVADSLKEKIIRKTIKRASDDLRESQSGWGSMPASVRAEIERLLNPTIDWRSVLKLFVSRSVKAERRLTKKRINRRTPYIYAGKRNHHMAKICISIDQSGSVSDAMIAKFFSELYALSDLVSFTVLFFDTQVDEESVIEWRKGQSVDLVRTCQGGTCFDAPTLWVNERNFDGHIICTDMQAPEPANSKCQRLWITDEASKESSWSFSPSHETVLTIPND